MARFEPPYLDLYYLQLKPFLFMALEVFNVVQEHFLLHFYYLARNRKLQQEIVHTKHGLQE